jgi:pimeloyl-ACP methyl ester carboxylesterase
VADIDEHEHWIESSGGRLFAKSWAPHDLVSTCPLILLHDSLGSVALWRDFPKRLAGAVRRRVITYDRLGFGRSDARTDTLGKDFIRTEAEQFLPLVSEALSILDFVVCGHSVGGGMAVEAGAAFPDQCRGVVTIAAQAFVDERICDSIRIARQEFATGDNMARLARHHGDKAAWVLKAWIETWLAPSFADWNLDSALQKLRCPLVAIHGERDEYGSVAHALRIAERGRGRCEIMPDVGHTPHRECPDLLIEKIQKWLAQWD